MAEPAADVAWSPANRGRRLRVGVADVLEDARSALAPVLDATPGWEGGAASAQATVEQVSGAMTNLVFICRSPAAAPPHAAVIVRVFGQGGQLFSQRDERNIFLLASDLGLGPKCLVEFENGRVEQFLPGDGLTCDSWRDPAVSAAIAAALARFHVCMLANLPSAGPSSPPAATGSGNHAAAVAAGQAGACAQLHPAIYDRIRRWHAAAGECGADLAAAGLTGLPDELGALQARLEAAHPAWVAFCHNDLQYGNMLLLRGAPTASSGCGCASAAAAAGADGQQPAAAAAGGGGSSCGGDAGQLSITLIDYEYSTLNDVAFDAANHFCEWAYNYHGDQPHVFQQDRLPSEEQQLHFCRAYATTMLDLLQEQRQRQQQHDAPGSCSLPAAVLGAGAAAADGGGGGGEAVEAAARMLQAKAQAHLPLVHLKWGLWGLIQDKMSDVDFDYAGYARQRIDRWHASKR